jgi:hypothetical protein
VKTHYADLFNSRTQRTACGRERDRTTYMTAHEPSVTCGVCRKVLGLPCDFPKPEFEISEEYRQEKLKEDPSFCPVNPEGWHNHNALAGGIAEDVLVFKRVSYVEKSTGKTRYRWQYGTECDYCGILGHVTILETDIYWDVNAAEPKSEESPHRVDF